MKNGWKERKFQRRKTRIRLKKTGGERKTPPLEVRCHKRVLFATKNAAREPRLGPTGASKKRCCENKKLCPGKKKVNRRQKKKNPQKAKGLKKGYKLNLGGCGLFRKVQSRGIHGVGGGGGGKQAGLAGEKRPSTS